MLDSVVLSVALRRIGQIVPVLLVVSILIFSLMYFTPGDPALIIAGERATDQEVELVRQSLALDRPVLERFATWAGHVVTGDLGQSIFAQQPVGDLILAHLGPTLALMLATLLIACTIAIPMGVFAAYRRFSWLDKLITAGTVAGFSVPLFVVGYLLAYLFGVMLAWLPVQGFVPLKADPLQFLRHLALPAMTLALVYASIIARTTRASMIEALSQDFVRTAQAKGLSTGRILFVHCLKSAAVPVLTVIGLGFATLVGGAVVTETVFGIPGLGRLTVDSILRRDYPVIQGVVLLFSAVYVLVNLAVDLSYLFVDPRVRY